MPTQVTADHVQAIFSMAGDDNTRRSLLAELTQSAAESGKISATLLLLKAGAPPTAVFDNERATDAVLIHACQEFPHLITARTANMLAERDHIFWLEQLAKLYPRKICGYFSCFYEFVRGINNSSSYEDKVSASNNVARLINAGYAWPNPSSRKHGLVATWFRDKIRGCKLRSMIVIQLKDEGKKQAFMDQMKYNHEP